ncbi:hypothetical protein pipiens_005765 [Culex pipiens pipiens]|uniref:CCHC-type domain-containing protein n=1 Tax=Culex pipiens pipiens TaxID=38569 RepID=A0ABD1DU33_CULPP
MDRAQKKNTVGFDFGRDGVMPTLKEAITFLVQVLKIKDTEVHSVYLDISDKTFFVKFTDEMTLKETTQRLRQTETFKYADGREVQVHVAVADGFFRYVRLFNLPPEVTDAEIAKALAKFGTVRQLVREKLPLELGFNAFSGTRGAHMEVKTEIPPALYIGHYKCRIFYEGLRNRCFTCKQEGHTCKQEGHVKADCPQKASAHRTPASDGTPSNGCEPVDYAAALKGLGSPLPALPALPLPAIPNGERLMSLVNEPDDRMIVSPKEGGDSEGTVKPENRMIVSPKEGGDSEETVEVKKRRTDSPKEGGKSDGRVEPDRAGGDSDGAGDSMEMSPNGVEPPKPPRGRPTDKTPKGESGKPQPRLTIPNLLKVLDGRSRSRKNN